MPTNISRGRPTSTMRAPSSVNPVSPTIVRTTVPKMPKTLRPTSTMRVPTVPKTIRPTSTGRVPTVPTVPKTIRPTSTGRVPTVPTVPKVIRPTSTGRVPTVPTVPTVIRPTSTGRVPIVKTVPTVPTVIRPTSTGRVAAISVKQTGKSSGEREMLTSKPSTSKTPTTRTAVKQSKKQTLPKEVKTSTFIRNKGKGANDSIDLNVKLMEYPGNNVPWKLGNYNQMDIDSKSKMLSASSIKLKGKNASTAPSTSQSTEPSSSQSKIVEEEGFIGGLNVSKVMSTGKDKYLLRDLRPLMKNKYLNGVEIKITGVKVAQLREIAREWVNSQLKK